ncbi:MAG: hypothetical protein HQK83_02945 [Fibrobacteria bacterium]|nr:hypothetical protein [Fibrobacteria bacterium]
MYKYFILITMMCSLSFSYVGIGWLGTSEGILVEFQPSQKVILGLNCMVSLSERPSLYQYQLLDYSERNSESASYYCQANLLFEKMVYTGEKTAFYINPFIAMNYQFIKTKNLEVEIENGHIDTLNSYVKNTNESAIGWKIGLRPELELFKRISILGFFGFEGNYHLRTLSKEWNKKSADWEFTFFGNGFSTTSINLIIKFGKK